MSSLSLTVFCFIFYHLLLNCNLQFDVVDIDESIPYILRKRRIEWFYNVRSKKRCMVNSSKKQVKIKTNNTSR